jgi:putative peptidoglycan lipid II flippase
MLLPAAAFTLVLAEPITRLLYERGAFGPDDTDRVTSALVWFSLSLPFSGANLLLTRTFFSLQRPWIPTGVAVLSLAVNAAVSVALYAPFGIPGIVIGTVVSTAATTFALAFYLRRELAGRLEAGTTASAVARMALSSALLAAVAYGVWWGLDRLLGDALIAQTIAVGAALVAGSAVYAAAVLATRVSEAESVVNLVRGRIQARREGGR